MSMVGFPLLLIPLAIYNMIVFLMPGVAFSEILLRLQLPSGEVWTISLGDMLLALGVLLLLLEVIKAAKPNGKYLTDHLLSLLVFGGAAAEFAMWPKFGNSTFLLLTLLAMVDFFGGVALRTKRAARAVVAAPDPVPAPAKATVSEPQTQPPVEEPAGEPVKEPAKAELPPVEAAAPIVEESTVAVPAAASVAESVLLDRSVPPLPAPVQTTGWISDVKEAEAATTSAPEPELLKTDPPKTETPKTETPKS